MVGCDGGDETTQPTPDVAIDFGIPTPDAAPLPFEPAGEPDIPGDEQVYALDRQRCQIIADHVSSNSMVSVARFVWTYDGLGNLTLAERDEDGDGNVDQRISRQFAAAERPTRISDDRDGDGLPDSLVSITYTDMDRADVLYDDDADGMIDRREVKTYLGNRVVEEAWYAVNTDTLQSRTVYTFDMADRPTGIERFAGENAELDFKVTIEYDDAGRQVRTTQDEGADGELELDIRTTHEDEARRSVSISDRPQEQRTARAVELYDSSNRLMQKTLDIGDDGTLEETINYTYDDLKLTSREAVTPTASSKVTYAYDDEGRILTVTIDDNPQIDGSDITVQYTHLCRSSLD
ncbi:MAG: hypothetical protein CMH52_09570 [Myxococcales bacterium]|nr:hypothetical protein [Myxococcales bacterium]